MHASAKALVVFLVLSLYSTTMAVHLKPKSMAEHESESSSSSGSGKNRKLMNTAATLLQQNTHEWIVMSQTKAGRSLASTTTTTTTCPVCEGEGGTTEDMNNSEEEEEQNGDKSRFGSAISKVKTSLNTEGTVLNTVKDGVINITKTALGIDDNDKLVSVETIVPILLLAANQFTSIGQRIQGSQRRQQESGEITSDTAALVMSIYDLLRSIVTGIADLLFSIITTFEDLKMMLIQGVVSAIVAILNVLEGIKLGIINAIVDVLNSIINGGNNSVARKMVDDSNGPIQTIKNILASGRLGGIFSDVIASLQESGDDTGLIPILLGSATDMEVLGEKLDVFLNNANQVMADEEQNTDTDESSSTSTQVAISEDTVTEILNTIVEIITGILNFIVSLITTVINLIAGIISSIIMIIIGLITGIIDFIISILNSILGIFSRQTGVPASTNTVTLMGIMTTILASPLYDIMICQLGLSSCTTPQEGIDCDVEALACENERLTNAMSE